jgi:heme exporter protein B
VLTSFVEIVRRELLLALRRRGDVLSLLVFFVIVVSLFPFGIGPELETLREIASGVVWVAALLATMLALNRLFAGDYTDGALEQLMLLPQPPALMVLAKITAHWLLTGLPLALVAPLLGLQYGLTGQPLLVMSLALALGSPALSAIGAIGAALTLGLRGGGVLLALLVLPLFVPVLIFGAGALDAAVHGAPYSAHLLLLTACSVAALTLAPLASAAALRIAIE